MGRLSADALLRRLVDTPIKRVRAQHDDRDRNANVPALRPEVWSDDERTEFEDFIAAQPDAGDVVPGAAPLRKVRWSRDGMGKRGGVR